MDKQRARILIKKMNSLFSSIEMEEGPISNIERDLMLKYIRDFYEVFVEEGTSTPKSTTRTSFIPKTTTPAPKRSYSTKVEPISTPKPTTLPPTTTTSTTTTTTTSTTTPAPRTTTAKPVVNDPVFSGQGSSKVEKLFSFREATELSEKLSEQPIRDLLSALSINDKLLYSNELFGRQPNILTESLQTLNRFDSMFQAKSFLISLAEQYNWAEGEREDIAKNFIKTIRRRYL